jgi:polyisoprenyl-phosphate glycosyltransferase
VGAAEISVVVPVFKCAECIAPLHERLTNVLQGLGVPYELVFVDDRSPDGAWDELWRLHDADPYVRAVRLSRNFGQHPAISAGLAEASGAWIVVMDCDLQDPPEAIPRLYAEAQAGAEVVFTRALSRGPLTPRRFASVVNARARRLLLGLDVEAGRPNFSIISRKVAEAFLRVTDANRTYQLVLAWLGFEQTCIDLDRDQRYAGESSYTWRGLVKLATSGLFFEPAAVARWLAAAGVAAFSLTLGVDVVLLIGLLLGRSFAGWVGPGAIVATTGAFVMMTTGLTALYAGKVVEQAKGRPPYVVDERLGMVLSTPTTVESATELRSNAA